MTAPDPPPPGGAEPRVSDRNIQALIVAAKDWIEFPFEHPRFKKADSPEQMRRFMHGIVDMGTRLASAEAALREMTEQRDGAWETGALAMRDAIVEHLRRKRYAGKGHEDENSLIGMFARGVRFAVQQVAALAPPAETAAKEERPDR